MHRYDNVTFLVCLPRARSAWLATFLKPVAWTMHDPLKQCESVDELGSKIDAVLDLDPLQSVFVADTSAALFFGHISARFINAKYMFIERKIVEIARSLDRQDMPVSPAFLERYANDYHRALVTARARRDLMLELQYDEISQRLLNIWRFVGNGNILSDDYAKRMKSINIQIPFPEQRANTDLRKTKRLLSTIGLRT